MKIDLVGPRRQSRVPVCWSSDGTHLQADHAANVAANVDHVLRLRGAGLNVFIFDCCGYCYSTGGPAREKLLYEDADRAWKYPVAERNIPPANIRDLPALAGLGAVAIDLAEQASPPRFIRLSANGLSQRHSY